MGSNPYSSLKIFHHMKELEAIGRGEHIAPFYIRLKPTNICNQHCAYCTYGSGDTEEKTENRDDINHLDVIPWEKMQEIIQDMGQMGVRAVTFSGGGEPLFYPHIAEAAQMILDQGMDLSLISNGSLLRGNTAKVFSHAKWVRISFDSPYEETYCKLRGVNPAMFRRVIENIRDFARMKDADCVLGVNFVISKTNATQVYDAAKLLKELGVDNVKFAAVIGVEGEDHIAIKDDVIAQIHRAKTDFEDEGFRIINNYEQDWSKKNNEGQSFPVCYTCRLVTVIAADQRVYLCHTRAYDSNAVVGSLKEQSFRTMWFSKETAARLVALRPQVDCRNSCVYQDRNEAIRSYFDVDMRHVNFI